MTRKRKVLWISDHPILPSGVGTQSRYVIEGLLATGRYSFICAGGAIQHPNYTPQLIEPERYGEDWKVFPVNGYGSKDFVRQMLIQERPDAVVIFTDPRQFIFTDTRQFIWIWEIEDEVRSRCPLIYWHVWDNDPTPHYNRGYYESNDFIVALSLKTYGILQDMDFRRFNYIPHAVSPSVFRPLSEVECVRFRQENLGPHRDRKFILFWNNRNARRKQTGDVIACFSKFSEQVGRDNVALMMHTAPSDPEGQDIFAVAKAYGVENLIISENRVDPDVMNGYYNACDATINIASNEGFGLGTLESLMSGTPILVHMTGGLQFQVGYWWKGLERFSDQDEMTRLARRQWKKNSSLRSHDPSECQWWGVPVFPASRSCTGSQEIPYIYDDRVCHADVVRGLVQLYEMGRSARRELGRRASEWARQTFSMEQMIRGWDLVLGEQTELFRSNPRQGVRVTTV